MVYSLKKSRNAYRTYVRSSIWLWHISRHVLWLKICEQQEPREMNVLVLKKNWAIFEYFWALWSPGGTQYPSPDTLWMTILSLGHSIMCVSKRNLIQCRGDMALMAIICEKWHFFVWFFMIFWTFGVQMGPISFTRRHMNDYFIFGTLNPVCNNEKFD